MKCGIPKMFLLGRGNGKSFANYLEKSCNGVEIVAVPIAG